jgi:hypothetical protein
MSPLFEDCVTQLIKHKVVEPDNLKACTPADIALVAGVFGRPLPRCYEEFLRIMGRGAGRFLASTDCFFPAVLELNDAARQLAADSLGEIEVPPNCLVFSMHGGYEFEYFTAGEGDDPPVYQCLEGRKGVVFVWQSFSAFFCDAVRQHTGDF